MKYFLDSAKIDEIDYAYQNYGIDGVTTNPKHVMLSEKPLSYFIEHIIQWVKDNKIEGYERFPISVEIDPFLDNADDMCKAAREISAKCTNFVIKIPCTEQGIIAARRLELEGVRTNMTLVFSPSQAIMPAKIGCKFVSPFIGWKENSGDDAFEYLEKIKTIYDNYGYETEIIVAAIRNGKQIADAAALGCDIVTCGLSVYKESFEHPFTTYGTGVFQNAWKNTKKD